jgi:hypothetical protein
VSRASELCELIDAEAAEALYTLRALLRAMREGTDAEVRAIRDRGDGIVRRWLSYSAELAHGGKP